MARLLTPAALTEQQTVGQIAIAGRAVVYTLRRVVDGAERTELWTVPLAGGEPAPLVSGPGSAFCPRIDPAGSRVAFLRTEYDGPAQPFIVRLAGGAVHALAEFPRGALDLAWDADGESLVVLAPDGTSPRMVYADGVAPGGAPTAIRLTTIDWRVDGGGEAGLDLTPHHLHRVSVGDGAAGRLTAGAWSASRPRVDGSGRVHFLADMSVDADLDPNLQLYRLAPDGTPQALTAFAGGVIRYHVTGGTAGAAHEAKTVGEEGTAHTTGTSHAAGASHAAGPTRLAVLAVPVAGRPNHVPPRWYIAEETDSGTLPAYRHAGGSAHLTAGLLGDETDLHDWHLELDDSATATTLSHRGSTMPVALVSGRNLTGRVGVCGAIAADDGRAVAALALGGGDERLAPDLYVLRDDGGGGADRSAGAGSADGPDGGPRRLTRHGDWLAAFAAPVRRRWSAAGAAGTITVHLVEPPDGVPTRGTVIDLHGGPTGQWAVVPPLEALLLASAGYRVALPNIRGSIDRGSLWVVGLSGHWGEADVADVLAVADALVADGLADADRLGVMGLSYGGFLTQYLIGVTDRFAAAVAENGVTNQVFAWSASADGPAYNVSAGLADPLTRDGAARLWAASPLRNVAAIRTPLLMLQGADDRTCPASDNEQLFVALRALRREVEYVLYPQESHLMQATGRLDRRIDRHERVIAWFDTHLGKQVTQ